MPYELCRHIKTNGKRCEAPALTGEMWCYFHDRLIRRHRNLAETKAAKPLPRLYLPPLEDRESVQVAISLVVDAIVTGLLEEKRAAVLLRAIGLAARNVVGIETQPCPIHKAVRSYMPTLDGHATAPRQMDDHSTPPAIPSRGSGHLTTETAGKTGTPHPATKL